MSIFVTYVSVVGDEFSRKHDCDAQGTYMLLRNGCSAQEDCLQREYDGIRPELYFEFLYTKFIPATRASKVSTDTMVFGCLARLGDLGASGLCGF